MNKEQNKNYFLWAALIAAYAAFIFIFTWLWPYGMDEIRYMPQSFGDVFNSYLFGYLNENSRIGLLINDFFLYLGKPAFIFCNTIIQTLIPIALYYLVFLRLPDFKTRKDFFAFVFTTFCCIFAVAEPDNTLFWIGGACNYSWVFLAFLVFMIFLRLHIEGKKILSPGKLINSAALLGGIILGMSNENNGPMAFGICLLFFIYCLWKKMKIPSWSYFVCAGIILGLTALFCAPGPYKRLNYWAFENFRHASASDKMFMHLSRMNDFAALCLLMPVLTPLGLFICAIDSDKPAPVLKNKNFIYSLLLWGINFTLAFVLFNAPSTAMRVFYSASLFAAAAFIFFVEYIKEIYGIRLYKYLCAAAAVFVLFTLPRFSIPYINLYRQNSARNAQIEQAKKENKKVFYAQKFYVLEGPTKNLSIEYYDYINPLSLKKAEQYYGIKFEEINKSNSVSLVTKNI